jgi:glycosyltransferase involved in cell wall biosynthesis
MVQSPLLINLSMLMARPTGISTYALNVVPHLAALEPTLLTAQPQQFLNFKTQAIPGDLTPEQGSRGHARRLVWTQQRLPRHYQAQASSLIFSPVPEMPLWRGCRTVVMVHDFIPLRFPRWRSPLTQYFRFVVPQVLRQATHILCNSQSTADDVIRFGGVPAAKVTAIPLAHDADHFKPLGLPRQNYFLYLGRHDPYKGIDRAIAAFAQLPQSLVKAHDCELWIAGGADPRFTPLLQAQALELGVAERVKFLGYVPYGDLPRLLNQALAFVFPSQWEGFGLPVLEAMACGTPVITTAAGAIPEVVGRDAALVVSQEPAQSLGQLMQDLLAQPELARQLGDRSLLQASCFSWQQTGETTLSVLKQNR